MTSTATSLMDADVDRTHIVPETWIRPPRGSDWRVAELWTYRELLYFLVWRNLQVRYKQTVLGIAWVMLQPLCGMIVFSLFFGKLRNMPSDGLPYPVFSYTGLLPWNLFVSAVGAATNSVVDHAHIISKVYFPRLAIPVATLLAAILDFLLACLLLPVLMYWYGVVPSDRIWMAPLLVVALFLTCLGPGLWFAALNVQFRDVRYLVPFLLQLALFATPVIYPLSLIPSQWRWLYELNPMVGMVDAFRWCLLPRQTIIWSAVVSSLVVTLLTLVSGLTYFRYVEHSMADVV